MNKLGMKIFKIIFSFCLILGLSSCSHLGGRDKIIRDIAVGAAVGVVIAQATKDTHKSGYSVMYGGVGGTVAGLASTYINMEDDVNRTKELEHLKLKIAEFERQLRPQLVQQGKSLFSSPLPIEVSDLVDPGEWKRYKMDQWVQDPNQSNTWYRQVEMFEIIPPVAR